MKRLLTHPIVGWIIAAAAILWFLAKPSPPHLLDPKDRQRIEALQDTVMQERRRLDSLSRFASGAVTRGTLAETSARAADARSRLDRTRADSLARLAAARPVAADSTPSDTTATLWRQAYMARTAEVEMLRPALDSALAASKAFHLAADSLTAGLNLARVRLDSVTQANTMLLAIVTKAERGCRVPLTFGKVPCPSRFQTFVAGGAAGVILTILFVP